MSVLLFKLRGGRSFQAGQFGFCLAKMRRAIQTLMDMRLSGIIGSNLFPAARQPATPVLRRLPCKKMAFNDVRSIWLYAGSRGMISAAYKRYDTKAVLARRRLISIAVLPAVVARQFTASGLKRDFDL